MASLHDSLLGDFTRGGQVTLHFLRMTFQVIKRFSLAIILFYLIVTLGVWVYMTDSYDRYLGFRHAIANIGMFYGNGESLVELKNPKGTISKVRIAYLANSRNIRKIRSELVNKFFLSALYSALSIGILLPIIAAKILAFGKDKRREHHLRGGRILEAEDIGKMLRKQKRESALKVAGVPLIDGTETSHILLSGSPGTGKSTTLYDLMKFIRERGDRAITYSPSGDFIERYFKDGDHVLNPFDARCKTWNVWNECDYDYHFNMVAEAMIPDSNSGDPFWNNAARTLVSSLFIAMRKKGNDRLQEFLELLTERELSELHSYLEGTSAASIIDPESAKTAISIRTTAATQAHALQFVPGGTDTFNIRRWVTNDSGSDWVYLMAKPDQISSVRSLLSAWLEIFTNSLMSLSASRTRRIWLILDELPSLNKIPSLDNFLAQARKYGGCGVIAFQQLSQLRDRYGKDGAESLAGLCATWVCMRQNDPDTAKWVAQSFGESEINEAQHGLSYGASELRDGESLSKQRKKLETLLPAQISSLDNLEGYVRLPGEIPVAHFKMEHIPTPTRAEAFVPRQLELTQDSSRNDVPHAKTSDQSKAIPPKETATEDADEITTFGDFDTA